MTNKAALRWKRVGDITISEITNVYYLEEQDLIIVNTDTRKFTFGSGARELPELIDAIEEYSAVKHDENLELFRKIRSKMSRNK